MLNTRDHIAHTAMLRWWGSELFDNLGTEQIKVPFLDLLEDGGCVHRMIAGVQPQSTIKLMDVNLAPFMLQLWDTISQTAFIDIGVPKIFVLRENRQFKSFAKQNRKQKRIWSGFSRIQYRNTDETRHWQEALEIKGCDSKDKIWRFGFDIREHSDFWMCWIEFPSEILGTVTRYDF